MQARHGEGEDLLGSTTVTSGAGATSFSATVGATGAGRAITATATDLTTNDTSEFSACFTATQAPPPPSTGGTGGGAVGTVGRSGGGISRTFSMCWTLSHTFRSARTDLSSVNLSNDRSAFAFPLPWQAKQCAFRNGRTSFW